MRIDHFAVFVESGRKVPPHDSSHFHCQIKTGLKTRRPNNDDWKANMDGSDGICSVREKMVRNWRGREEQAVLIHLIMHSRSSDKSLLRRILATN